MQLAICGMWMHKLEAPVLLLLPSDCLDLHLRRLTHNIPVSEL